ncbi:MAG: threonylcarbamoyl-AMP synthase [Eubacterium sp.]|nr:threonylcarbamoyl-AMP synthase [Eubacterium sp.]HBE09606.1 threonylcarbamoyl-AMP synthase [Lachnospiraceae bacterium]
MKTIIKKTTENDAFSMASDILRNGGLVAFPTETVYGLGGNALDPRASEKIYAAKGRPSDNPLIVHIANRADVAELASEIPPIAEKLMDRFWPGPMTIIFNKKDIVPKETTGGLDTVAIRMPSHPDAARLIRESGVYIAAPSANASGRPSPSTAQHVEEDLSGRIDMILDGGPVDIGIESSIIDVTGDVPVILRPGFITRKDFSELIGEVYIDPAIIKPDPTLRPKAPGMKYTHYAPKGSLTIIEDKASPAEVTENVISTINRLAAEAAAEGKKAAVLTTRDQADKYSSENIILLGEGASGEEVAKHLYSALRECDDIGAELIYSESFNRDELGGAIMNRLLKAAGQKLIYV